MVGPSKEDLRRTPYRSTLSDLDYPGLRSVTHDVPARRILATVK